VLSSQEPARGCGRDRQGVLGGGPVAERLGAVGAVTSVEPRSAAPAARPARTLRSRAEQL